MRRPVSVKSVFLLPPCEFLVFEPSRLCRHPSIRTLFERFSLGASWASSFQQVLLPDNRSRLPSVRRKLGQELVRLSGRRHARPPEQQTGGRIRAMRYFLAVMRFIVTSIVALLLVLLLAGCTVGPKYVKPTVPTTPAYKEEAPGSFKEL